ncbi:MAG: HypC/HybG/HupF family hydrogenase formation chaperone [candidate division Zixibacteria bacterium]|nr:HypC/HybG/HupF family hydrogenase formation chaperone [candidate division Zixibacteria bacterium]
MCLAVPGKIIAVDPTESLMRPGKVDFGGVVKDVNLCYVPEAKVGDYVIVHVGFALNVIDDAEAARVFEYLREIGEIEKDQAESA